MSDANLLFLAVPLFLTAVPVYHFLCGRDDLAADFARKVNSRIADFFSRNVPRR